jgi:hypothetical protein
MVLALNWMIVILLEVVNLFPNKNVKNNNGAHLATSLGTKYSLLGSKDI